MSRAADAKVLALSHLILAERSGRDGETWSKRPVLLKGAVIGNGLRAMTAP